MRKKINQRAFTLVEITITLTIIAILAAIVIATMAGTGAGDHIDRAAQSIYSDLLLIRSRAVSTNLEHRLNFISSSQWKVQAFNTTTSAWEDIVDTRTMPSDTFLSTATYTLAATNLEASPRGLFVFNSPLVGPLYAQVQASGTSKSKSVKVYVGGAVEITIP